MSTNQWEIKPSHLTTGFDILGPTNEHGSRDVIASYVRAEHARLIANAPELLRELMLLNLDESGKQKRNTPAYRIISRIIEASDPLDDAIEKNGGRFTL